VFATHEGPVVRILDCWSWIGAAVSPEDRESNNSKSQIQNNSLIRTVYRVSMPRRSVAGGKRKRNETNYCTACDGHSDIPAVALFTAAP
jgi:hypothetical protein